MIEEEDIGPHPFNKRGNDIKRALYALLDEGPASWEAVFVVGRTLGYSDSTMRNAINEGCHLGIFEKSGGKAGRRAGRPTGPPMVHLTESGRLWYSAKLNTYEGDEPCIYCGATPTRHDDAHDEDVCRECEEAEE